MFSVLDLRFPRPPLTQLLIHIDAGQQDGQRAEDAEHEDDAWFFSGPVLALDELVESVFAAGEEGGVDCGHCEGVD